MVNYLNFWYDNEEGLIEDGIRVVILMVFFK